MMHPADPSLETSPDAQSEGADQQNIVWLASYPKSGNTWTRILLANLVGTGWDQENMHIDLAGSISSSRPRFDNFTGLPSSDLTDDEIDLVRPELYRQVARQSNGTLFVKVHDGYHCNAEGHPIFPADVTKGAIHIVRNPLDVAVSYAYHQGHRDFENSARQMADNNKNLAGRHKTQLRQKTLGWSGHYRSWADQSAIPTLCVRYEDLLADTAAELTRMARFLGLEEAEDEKAISEAVQHSQFKELQRSEEKFGFPEKPERAERFFRSGRSGEGLEKLPTALRQKICTDHREAMIELGYLASD